MPMDASDEMQLLGATSHGASIFTFNIADFARLADRYPRHAGIIVAVQRDWTLSSLIHALDRLLSETQAEELIGQFRWLNEWANR